MRPESIQRISDLPILAIDLFLIILPNFPKCRFFSSFQHEQESTSGRVEIDRLSMIDQNSRGTRG
ncbi:hypothetical protein Plim_4201 [Planctopirus limnophila DSM 3776]|uniref:Uncharacterized protein n=1 Tax=Planctopirus limnophila (strain ATCC 43296 / DSM 3776 / IFAM 1008 / Mu 290) TaxID=521674 RepID=D5SZA8_PLAL2|nr:hypothetical protein Plim_4201 [Planctopirus limnophila DSM 3776]